MTLKKTAKSKRTNPLREFTRTKEFTKDWQRLAHSGRYDMNSLKDVMLLLIENSAPLPAEWLDHPLRGNG
jgi:mRNA interferase YafQ